MVVQVKKNAKKSKGIFSWTLFKQSLKSNWILWTIFTTVLVLMMAIMSIAIPQSNMTKNIDPKQLAPRILIMYYGQMTGFFIMIYTIITANSLVASQVDRGSMAYTLSTPIKRTKVTITQMIYLITALFTMTMLVAIVNIICFSFGHNLSLDIEDVLLMAAGCFLLQVTIASISFMASCIFNLSKFSFSLGAGIPVAFYLFSILSQISGLEFLRFFTIFTLFDVGEVKMGQGGMVTDGWILNHVTWKILASFGAFVVMSCIFFTIGHIVFKKKDLPL